MLNYARVFILIVTVFTFFEPTKQQGGCDCGVANRRTRVVNGKVTNTGEWPSMGLVYKVARDSTGKIIANDTACGSALINSQYVLTAAHCIYQGDPSSYVIDFGDQDLKTSTEAANIIVDVIQLIWHKDYDTGTFANDIGLMKLAKAITYTNNIKPICIPPPGLNCEGQLITIAGFGTTGLSDPKSTVQLDATLTVISNSQCKPYYDGSNVNINPSVICAQSPNGSTPQDACQGDSGGPAFMECGGRYLVVGIISAGFGCATVPGIYTNVSYYRDWIVNNTTPTYSLCGYDCYPPNPQNTACGFANAYKAPTKRDEDEDEREGEISKRISNGTFTGVNQYPWMVAVYVYYAAYKTFGFICGGTLISQQWVVTAATCVYGQTINNVTLYLGKYNINKTESSQIQANLSNIYIHPNYSNISFDNNIALLKLISPVTMGKYTYPLCLPTSLSMENGVPAGTKLTFLGWGATGSAIYSPQLKQAVLSTINYNTCTSYLGYVPNTTICTTSSSAGGVCDYDKGGPLMIADNDQRYFLIAIQSFNGNGVCGSNTLPAGNLAIINYLIWIASVSGVTSVNPSNFLTK